jgi:hypothetical protein
MLGVIVLDSDVALDLTGDAVLIVIAILCFLPFLIGFIRRGMSNPGKADTPGVRYKRDEDYTTTERIKGGAWGAAQYFLFYIFLFAMGGVILLVAKACDSVGLL